MPNILFVGATFRPQQCLEQEEPQQGHWTTQHARCPVHTRSPLLSLPRLISLHAPPPLARLHDGELPAVRHVYNSMEQGAEEGRLQGQQQHQQQQLQGPGQSACAHACVPLKGAARRRAKWPQVGYTTHGGCSSVA
eukprot:1155310-Pelagomonas_calceolata.AAC.8